MIRIHINVSESKDIFTWGEGEAQSTADRQLIPSSTALAESNGTTGCSVSCPTNQQK